MNITLARIRKFLFNPGARFNYLASKGFYDRMSDGEFLKRKFRATFGYNLDLEHPTTFNEKLQWLKLHDRKPEYTMMVDKYRVRKYIAEKIGEEHLIPLIGVWDGPEEIDFESLPDRFVLKCNHNSGLGMCICRDKSKLDIPTVKRKLKEGLAQDYYLTGREWPYKNVPRKIICEKYMTDGKNDTGLTDYKVLCFNGRAKLVKINRNRFTSDHTMDFYDVDWRKISVSKAKSLAKVAEEKSPRPAGLEEMINLSEKLACGIRHIRVDWYIAGNQLYFGELTFFDGSGFNAFDDFHDDELLGSWIDL